MDYGLVMYNLKLMLLILLYGVYTSWCVRICYKTVGYKLFLVLNIFWNSNYKVHGMPSCDG